MQKEFNYTTYDDQYDTSIKAGSNDELGTWVRGATATAFIVAASLVIPTTVAAHHSFGSGCTSRTLPRIEFANLRRKNELSLPGFDFDFTKEDGNYSTADIFIGSENLKHIDQRIREISNTIHSSGNGDNIAITPQIMSRTEIFLRSLPVYFLNSLNCDEDAIYPTSYGTMTIEWRPNEDNVVSVEIGNTTFNFYAIIDGKTIKSDPSDENSVTLTSKLESTLQKILALYYEPATVEC